MYRVKLQQGAMSAAAIREALLSVQASLYEDQQTGQVYQMPGRWLSAAEKLYKTMGLKLQSQARRLAPLSSTRRGGTAAVSSQSGSTTGPGQKEAKG